MPFKAKSFIAHQGRSQGLEVLVRFLTDVRSTHKTWRVGATVCLPSYIAPTAASMLGALDSVAAYALADPATHRIHLPLDKRGAGRKHLTYLTQPDPHKSVDAIVKSVLEAQVHAGRDVLVSPWLAHGVGAGQKNLRATRKYAVAAASHKLAQGRDLLLGLAVTQANLADDESRDDFLDEIVDWPTLPFYLHVWLAQPPESYRQFAHRETLLGLRKAVKSLSDNDHRVLLPQTGMFGWLMMPFGALGFGSGISSTLQALAVRPPGGSPHKLEWFFLPQFLGFVLRSEVPEIASLAAYEPCDCPYCPKLPLGQKGAWDFNLAGLHYLWWCARLASEQLHSKDPLGAVRKRIADAQEFAKAIHGKKIVLDRRSIPTHLGVWSEVVA